MVEHSNLIFDKNDYYLSEKDLHLIIAKHVEKVKHSLPFFKDTSSFDQGKSDESGRVKLDRTSSQSLLRR